MGFTLKQNNTTEIIKSLNLEEGGKIQTLVDMKIGSNLMKYVSFKDGYQERSIPGSKTYGKGKVMINVKYARYQAYSPKIHKRNGKRGTYPFERMKADKKDSILRSASEYSRRLDNG